MKFLFVVLIPSLLFIGCVKEKVVKYDSTILENYLEENSTLSSAELIACAGGNNTSFMGSQEFPIGIFFYPINGACEFRCYETEDVNVDPNDFSNYTLQSYSVSDLFGGKLKKFNHPTSFNEKWVMVTYKTLGKIHKCNPIRIKASVSPTNDISNVIVVTESGVNPSFNWENDNEPNNVIFFSVVSDEQDDFVSGTYTYDQFWTFYDLSNVVLNITESTPVLQANSSYYYTMMGVSVDNWVHSMAMKKFVTP